MFVILDETYDFLVYDNQPYFSLLSVPELKDRVIAACSFSKRYCMTGWRVGYMYASARMIKQVLKVHDAFAICAPTISQFAAAAALSGTNGKDGPGDESVRQLIETMTRRRDLVVRDWISFRMFSPMPNLAEVTMFSALSIKRQRRFNGFCAENTQRSQSNYGARNAFGPTGEGHIRMSFGAEETELTELSIESIVGSLRTISSIQGVIESTLSAENNRITR